MLNAAEKQHISAERKTATQAAVLLVEAMDMRMPTLSLPDILELNMITKLVND